MQADSPPLTTVVIAVWDDYVSERLGDALMSVQAQTAGSPIVVVDNASTTPLPPLPGAWVIRAPQRLTAGAARNLGLTRVTTPYVVFWDADDIMVPDTLQTLEAAVRADAELVAFGMAVVEEPSNSRHRWPRRWITRLIGRAELFALLDAVWSLFPSTGATIMRTELAQKAGGFADADAGEGWCLGVSLAFRGRLGWSEQPGRRYRVAPGSLWSQHMTPQDLKRHAEAVRERIRDDEGIPAWAKRSLPLILLAQHAAIGAHIGLDAARERLKDPRLDPLRRRLKSLKAARKA